MIRNACYCIALFAACSAPVERIQIAPGGKTFEYANTHRPFFVWGLNYDRDFKSRLLEEYWADEWPTVEADFKEMKALGANVVRVHLQLSAFLNGPDIPNVDNLTRLSNLVTLAENNGLSLDLTGLGAYQSSVDPEWYLALDEAGRWAAQAFFWQQVSGRVANRGGVFMIDLMNEPVIPGMATTDWTPGDLAGFSYVQQLVLDPAGRSPHDIANAWRTTMRDAIRSRDASVLISVGQLPFSTQGGFEPADHLDFLSVHIYPDSKNLPASNQLVTQFAAAGVPVLVEETFSLSCSGEEWEGFVSATREQTSGYVGFYWGQTREELVAEGSIGAALLADWLERFSRLSTQ